MSTNPKDSAASGAPRLRLVRTEATPNSRRDDLPDGVHSQTLSMLDTPAGRLRVRTRRVDFRARLGGAGTTWASRYEVAVQTPRSRRERLGFVVVSTGADGRIEAGSHLEAYLQAADWIARTIAAAPDRTPTRPERGARPTMPGAASVPASMAPPPRWRSPGHRLHAVLGAAGVEDHYGTASAIVGRAVTSLGQLSASERRLVEASVAPVPALVAHPAA